MTTTVAAVSILGNRAVLATYVPAFTLKVICMTTGTIRLERRERPDDGLGIVLVAHRTLEVACVIEWLVQQSRVHVDMRYPRDGRMTLIALTRRCEMAGVPAGRNNAVMTG